MGMLRGLVSTLFVLLLALPAGAADSAPAGEAPWQAVISRQIEAFRAHDAATAFSCAGRGFRVSFPSAEAFFDAVISSGYAPIMDSQSHSFGEYLRLGAAAAIQQVRLVGNGQERYLAVYQMTAEPEGWRVQGVQLAREAGIAI
jgi:hypothetical protein